MMRAQSRPLSRLRRQLSSIRKGRLPPEGVMLLCSLGSLCSLPQAARFVRPLGRGARAVSRANYLRRNCVLHIRR